MSSHVTPLLDKSDASPDIAHTFILDKERYLPWHEGGEGESVPFDTPKTDYWWKIEQVFTVSKAKAEEYSNSEYELFSLGDKDSDPFVIKFKHIGESNYQFTILEEFK